MIKFGQADKKTMRTRRRFLKQCIGAAPMLAGMAVPNPISGGEAAGRIRKGGGRVRDQFWVWSHEAHSYDNAYGLPHNGRITPVEGAHYLGVPNIIFIRYHDKPEPPFEQYAVPFKSLRQINWSITGMDGATSEEERQHVLRLAAGMPSITGVFMDDFFHIGSDKPHWLAGNNASFPVELTVRLPRGVYPTKLELVQSEWHSGDYRSKDFVAEGAAEAGKWSVVGRGQLPNVAGGVAAVSLGGQLVRELRIRILSSYDTAGALSCGLRQVRLWEGKSAVDLARATVVASSWFSGWEAPNVVWDRKPPDAEAPAALTVSLRAKPARNLRVKTSHL